MDRYYPLLLIGVCAVGFSWGIPTRCVQLPNGMNIGRQALVDLSKPYFRPEVVPKFENGKSLLHGDAWPFFTTETTVHGLALQANHQDDFWFSWRMDTGLIRKNEDPTGYERIIAEAGPLLEGTRYGAFGTAIIMRDLQKQPAYANQTCRTRWITW